MTEHPYDGAEGRPLLDLVIKGMSVVDRNGTHIGTAAERYRTLALSNYGSRQDAERTFAVDQQARASVTSARTHQGGQAARARD